MQVKYQNVTQELVLLSGCVYTYYNAAKDTIPAVLRLLLLKSFIKFFTEIIRDIISSDRKSFHTHAYIYINFLHRFNKRNGKHATSISKHFVYSTYLRFIFSRRVPFARRYLF